MTRSHLLRSISAMTVTSEDKNPPQYIIGFDVGGGTIRASLYKWHNGKLEKIMLPDLGDPNDLNNPAFTGIVVTNGVVKKLFRKGKANIIDDIDEVTKYIQSRSPEPISFISLPIPCRLEGSGPAPTHDFEDPSFVVQQANSGMDMAAPPSECWGTNWEAEITTRTGIAANPLNDANTALLAHWYAALENGDIADTAIGWGLYVGAGTGFGASAAQLGKQPRILHNAHMYDGMLALDSNDQQALSEICIRSGITIVNHQLSEVAPDTIFVERFPKLIENKPVFHLIHDQGKTYALSFQLFAASSIQTLVGGTDLKQLTAANAFGGHDSTLALIGKYMGNFVKGFQQGTIQRVPSKDAPRFPKPSGDPATLKWVFLGGGAFSGDIGERIKGVTEAACPDVKFIRTNESKLDVCGAGARSTAQQLQASRGRLS